MTRTILFVAVAFGAMAQTRNAEWVTNGADAQRSHWIPNDPKISLENLLPGSLLSPGFQFLWKTKLANDGAPTEAIIMDRYIGYRGFRTFAFVARGDDTLVALDSDLNRVEWQKRFGTGAGCVVSNAPAIARSITFSYPAFGNAGRVAWARSDVGDAGEGAVTLRAVARPAPPPPPPVVTAAAPVPPRPPSGPRPSVIYMITSDGMLRTVNVSNGDEMVPPMPFVPTRSIVQALTVSDNFAYAVTHDCDGGRGSVWSLDLAGGAVQHWAPENGDVTGADGIAFGPDGTIYAATTTGDLVSLASKTLAVKDRYAAGAALRSSPVVFSFKGRNVIAVAAGDGSIRLVDAALPGALLFKTAVTASADRVTLAAWQAPNGGRWLLASSNESLSVWKVAEQGGAIALEAGWTSRELKSPLTPMIVNGVVFALSDKPAVLRALDGETGKTLWNSGKTIAGVAGSGLSGGASQLYFSTTDGAIYAFGFPIEH